MKKVSGLSLALVLSALAGCSSFPDFSQSIEREEPTAEHLAIKQSFMDVYKHWQGVPYRLGGNSFSGVDCSAFVQIAYRDAMRFDVPRTTHHQVLLGKEVPYEEIQIGDLAFFKTSYKVNHVGVYIGDKQFMHASTSKGVIISRLDNPYWASKFWHFRRVVNSPE